MKTPQIEAILRAYSLKALARSGWQRVGLENVESVAAHSWGVALLSSLLCPEFLDRAKVLELAIIHDLAESEVGDITPHDDFAPEEKDALEYAAMQQICANAQAQNCLVLFEEYRSKSSPEAAFVHKVDKLDMALQAIVYQREQGVDPAEFLESALSVCSELISREELEALQYKAE
ncbi:MAG: HD domain-containing protein [Bradymonadales bacterium]